MEVYVFFTLVGLGYIASKSNSYSHASNASNSNTKKQKKQIPDNYNQRIMQQSREIEQEKIKSMYKKSRAPSKTNVISSDYKDIIHDTSPKVYESKLSGMAIPIDEFKHNNMEPFFGGSKKQNVNLNTGNDF